MSDSVILFVDDDSSIISAMRSLLTTHLGATHRLEFATSGAEALEIFAELEQDQLALSVVISDFIMPDMYGDELLIRLHQLSPHSIKIMLTGQSNFDGVKRAINQANLYRFLEKPFNNDDILMTVKSACQAFQHEFELKQQNCELITLNQELQQMLNTLNIQQEELKRSEQLKTNFISTVSHELRTPLTSISGSLGLIMGGAVGEVPAKMKVMLGLAHKNSLRLTHLINDLLDMEKLVMGNFTFDFKLQPLWPILESAVASAAVTAQANAITLHLEAPENLSKPLTMVNIDQNRLHQVLANLLSNAIKFSPSGKQIEISTCLIYQHSETSADSNPVENTPDWIRVQITDHGKGIPVDFHSRIFTKFSQADSSDTRQNQQGGTGLGLAICKELMTLMHGKIGFHSSPEIATCFYFDLPLCQPADPA